MESESKSTFRDGDESGHLFSEQLVTELLNKLKTASRPEQRDAMRNFVSGCSASKFSANFFNPGLKSDLLRSLASFGKVIEVTQANERDLEPNDFMGVNGDTLLTFKCIRSVMDTLESDSGLKNASVVLIIFCAQNMETNLWNSPETVEAARETMALLLKSLRRSSVEELLNEVGDESFRRRLFSAFSTCLTRANWKCDPASKAAFTWCLTRTRHPHVGDVLNEVLPVSLNFVDDFVVENRVCGLDCLLHLMNNSPTASMQWYGRADVVYNALKDLAYTREPRIIVALYPCLFRVLRIMLPDPKKPALIRKISHYDTLYHQFLTEMESEQVIAIRCAYSQHLATFIGILGITVVRHLPSTLKVILQYMEVYDGPEEVTRLNTLRALKTLVLTAWPRIPYHLNDIVKGLIKLLYDVPNLSSNHVAKESIIAECIECFELLRELSPAEINLVCESIGEITRDIPQLSILKQLGTGLK